MSDFCWFEFFVLIESQVQRHGDGSADLTLWAARDFPTFDLPVELSPVNLLTLATLLVRAEFAQSKSESWVACDELFDRLERLGCSEDDILATIEFLVEKEWAVEDETDESLIRANMRQLMADRLYYRTVWQSVRNLEFPQLCKN